MQSLYYSQGYTEEEATASTEGRASEVPPRRKCRTDGRRGQLLVLSLAGTISLRGGGGWGEKNNSVLFVPASGRSRGGWGGASVQEEMSVPAAPTVRQNRQQGIEGPVLRRRTSGLAARGGPRWDFFPPPSSPGAERGSPQSRVHMPLRLTSKVAVNSPSFCWL